MKRLVFVVVALLVVSACGREGGLVTSGAPGGFCPLAQRLERDATSALVKLGPRPSIDQTLAALKAFGEQRRSDYEELEHLAPQQLKGLLRAQREYRAQFTSVTGQARIDLLRRAVANGTLIKQAEVRLCSPSAAARLRPSA